MSSTAPNCDFDASIIDIHQRTILSAPKKRTSEQKKAFKWIRKNCICHLCGKYPGDSEWNMGNWDRGPYTCFDCY